MEMNQKQLQEALSAFGFAESAQSCERYGSGHINDTFCVTVEEDGKMRRYILQRMNGEVFKDPKGLMENVEKVTSFMRERIRENGGDIYRETLNLLPTREGKSCFADSAGNFWRSYYFIERATCYDVVKDPNDFYQSAKAFGRFQKILAKFPAGELHETIRNFHNTPWRFESLKKAIAEDKLGRAEGCRDAIEFALLREADYRKAQEMLERGELPLRVTHNDTKLNNIMIDDDSKEAICIIDLDTVMPGLSIFDYGDSIRFGANTAEEDERDLSKVSLSLPLFDVYTKGFLEGCEGSLTKAEIEMLPMGAKLMTAECGMRFLTDYLEGDSYFRIHREGQNLDRARCQFALVADMEKKWDEMKQIVEKYA